MHLLVVAVIIAVAAYFIFFKKEKYTNSEIIEKLNALELPPSADIKIKSYMRMLNNKPENSKEIINNYKDFIKTASLTEDQKSELKNLEDEIIK
jgi:hypothetical protein